MMYKKLLFLGMFLFLLCSGGVPSAYAVTTCSSGTLDTSTGKSVCFTPQSSGTCPSGSAPRYDQTGTTPGFDGGIQMNGPLIGCESSPTVTPDPTPAPTPTAPTAPATTPTPSGATSRCVNDENGTSAGLPDSAGKCPPGSSLVGSGGTTGVASSPNLTYIPLEPLPGENTNGQPNFCQLVNLVFKLLIYLGGMIAVLFLVLSGITYMISEVVNKKDFARNRIKAAVWGLILLLSSWLILNTINPQLVTACNILNPSTVAGIATVPAQDQTASLRAACQAANGKNGVLYETGTNLQVGTGVLGMSLLISPIGPLYAFTLKALGKDILTSINPLDAVPATCANSYLANSGGFTCKDIVPGELCLIPAQ